MAESDMERVARDDGFPDKKKCGDTKDDEGGKRVLSRRKEEGSSKRCISSTATAGPNDPASHCIRLLMKESYILSGTFFSRNKTQA